MVWVTNKDNRPAPRLISRCLPRKTYTNPTRRTIKDAPSREPAIIAKDSLGARTPASRNANEVAAMGDPERTILADSHPKPNALAGLLTEKWFRITGASGFAPSLTKIKANINRPRLARKRGILVRIARACLRVISCLFFSGGGSCCRSMDSITHLVVS